MSMSATLRAATTPHVLLLLIAGACTDRELPVGLEATAGNMVIVSGNQQSAPAGTELPDPLVVRVTNSSGTPLANQIVNFRITGGSGSVYAGTGLTNASGLAQESWTLGDTPGEPQTLEARAVNSSTGAKEVFATFAATAVDSSGGGGGGGVGGSSSSLSNECSSPQTAWIWCDDFEQNRLGSYFEYDDANGAFTRATGVGVNSTSAMRAHFSTGQVSAGSLKLAFGRTPDPYMDPVDAGTANHRDVYWRFYLRYAPNWTGGGGDKLSRGIVFAASNWSEAAIGHVWSGNQSSNWNHLLLEPTSGTDAQGNLRTTGYNDFDNMRWLGSVSGTTPLFDGEHVGNWYCIETHMRLNDAGQSNGAFEYWIDGELEARTANHNWLGSFNAFGINALFVENYWNQGAPKAQDRYIDNLVVSTSRIGCGDSSSPGGEDPTVASVAVTPASASLAVGGTQQFTATAEDAAGDTISRKTFSWSSSNSSVATVNSSGVVTGRAAGTASIRATTDSRTGTATVNVQNASPTVESVSVSPASASLSVGGTRQVTATARDANGDAISGKTFSWTSNNTSVATVTSSGLVTARAAGSAIIRAAVDSESGSSAITVTAGDAVGSSARLVEDFSTYTSKSHMLSDPRGIYMLSEDIGTGSLTLDTSVGYGGSDRSMRYTHTSGQTISRSLDVQRWNLPGNEDLWTEIVVRFSPNWRVGAAYKLLHLITDPTNGRRFGLEFESGTGGTLNAEAPASNYDAAHMTGPDWDTLFDGNWHVIRYHTKIVSGGSQVFHEWWIDGQYQGSAGPMAGSSGLNHFTVVLGANMNESNGQTQNLWWGRIQLWTSDPGW